MSKESWNKNWQNLEEFVEKKKKNNNKKMTPKKQPQISQLNIANWLEIYLFQEITL